MEELIIEEISSRCSDHVHHVEVGTELRTIHILYQMQILVRTARYHPRHRLDAEFGMLRPGCVNDLPYHRDSHLP